MNFLVTRPKGKGQTLVDQINGLGQSAHYQPIIDIAPGPDQSKLPELFERQNIDMLIFVSTFAADYFIKAIKDPLRLKNSAISLVAVGRSTAKRLTDWGQMDVLVPEVETTEGLLSLFEQQQQDFKGKNIVIVRGVGGRELLSEQLQSKQATVTYWQLYQRVVMDEAGLLWYDQWQSKQIDCIIVTSTAILTAIFDKLPDAAKGWLSARRWIVASSRIAAAAKKLGIETQQIIDAQGATDQALLRAVQELIET